MPDSSEGPLGTQAIQRLLLREEVCRIIASAAAAGSLVRTGHEARAIHRTYPEANMTLQQIVEVIAAAADAAHVPAILPKPDEP